MAAIVGEAGPLAFLLALVAMLLVSYAFVVLAADFASAGSVFAFNGRALGYGYGFMSAWMLLGVYIAYSSSIYASNANFLESLAGSAHAVIAWPVFAFAVWALALVLAYRRISVSTMVIFALEGVAIVLVAIVAVAVLLKGGAGGHAISAVPFTLRGIPVAIIGLGVIFAFTGFSGFEVSATLGEETARPRRVIPASMIAALLVSGAIYVMLSWIETIAYPSAGALANQSVPLVDRLLFALARDGFGPRWLATVSRRQGSPVGALAVVGVVSIVAVMPFMLNGTTPIDAFFYLATYGADLIIIAYLLTAIAALVWSIRRGRAGVVRVVGLVAAISVMAYIIKGTVYPVPASPFDLCIDAAGITIAAGVALLLLPRLRANLSRSPLFAIAPADSAS
jgi:amino acid transporter